MEKYTTAPTSTTRNILYAPRYFRIKYMKETESTDTKKVKTILKTGSLIKVNFCTNIIISSKTKK